MKKILIISIVLLMTVFSAGCGRMKELRETREMEIDDVDLSTVADGNYRGYYTYAGIEVGVEVQVRDHRIERIAVLKAYTTTKQSKEAAAIVDTVIARQSLAVDVISGATTSSKAYLKAMENALKEGIE